MKLIITILFAVLASATLAVKVSHAADLAAGMLGNDYQQWDAAIFLNPSTPQVADWIHMPALPANDQVLRVFAVDGGFLIISKAGNLVFAVRGANSINFTAVKNTNPFDTNGMQFTLSKKYGLIGVSPAQFLRCAQVGVAPTVNCVVSPIKLLTGQSSVTAIAVQHVPGGNDLLMVGTDAGLMFTTLNTFSPVRIPLQNMNATTIINSKVTQVYCLPATANPAGKKFRGGQCFVSTNEGYPPGYNKLYDLVHRIAGNASQHYYITPGIIHARPTAYTYDATWDAVHMANEMCDDVLFANGTLMRLGGYYGRLPQRNLTTAASTGDSVWFGSQFGLMRRAHTAAETNGAGNEEDIFSEFSQWRYFFGPRWLPSDRPGMPTVQTVSDLAVQPASSEGPETAAAIIPGVGISFISFQSVSLADKAKQFQKVLDERHDFYGLCSDAGLEVWGQASTFKPRPSANSGLWSSLCLASQAFRYATTKDPEAKAAAWRIFYGMLLDVNVTGVKGYPARQAWPAVNGSCHVPPMGKNEWFASPSMPGWCFNGGTSSDEITGHLHVYPLMWDLVAETPAEKAIVAGVIDDMTGHIVDHNFTLVGHDGVVTHWGKWDPQDINGNIFFYDGRGVQSLQMLQYLSSAYRVTGKQKYVTAFRFLVDEAGYAENLINAKITQLTDVNYSDDELTFLPYLAFFWSGQPSSTMKSNPLYEELKENVLLSIQRTERYVKKEKPNLWNIIYLSSLQLIAKNGQKTAPALVAKARAEMASDEAQRLQQDAMSTLQTWPMSWVNWPVDNSRRIDVIPNPQVDRSGQSQSMIMNLLPYDELSLGRWNGNPFRSRQGSGNTEVDPGAWLYPYWLGRYFNLVPAS